MLHRKKLLALALTTALGAPALASAQTSEVVLYGKFYPEIEWTRGHGATDASTPVATMARAPTGDPNTHNIYGMSSSNSRFGIRGTERLSSTLTAIFQIESDVAVDQGGGTLAGRDTFVGLKSDAWGTVKLGNFDTVYKNLGDTLSFLSVSSGNFVSISNTLSKSPFDRGSAGSFHLRRGNSVQYESPEFTGLTFLIQYSPDEAKTSTRNADLLSTGVQYERGPLYAAIAYERHNDFFGGSRTAKSSLSNFADPNADSKDEAIRGTLQYKFGRTTVEGNLAHLQYKESGGAIGKFQEYKHYAWSIGLDHRMGPWRFAASYAHGTEGDCSLIGGASCSTDGLNGDQYNLGAMYYFSRRTQVFLIGSVLNNGKSARYNNNDEFVNVVAGMDTQTVALGIAHSF